LDIDKKNISWASNTQTQISGNTFISLK